MIRGEAVPSESNTPATLLAKHTGVKAVTDDLVTLNPKESELDSQMTPSTFSVLLMVSG